MTTEWFCADLEMKIRCRKTVQKYASIFENMKKEDLKKAFYKVSVPCRQNSPG